MSRTNWLAMRTPMGTAIVVLALAASPPAFGDGDAPAVSDSAMVKLLKSGRVPEERQGAVMDMIGKRGTVADLDYIYRRALDGGFPMTSRAGRSTPWPTPRSTRGLRPVKDREHLVELLTGPSSVSGGPLQGPAIRLAGGWKLEAAAGTLARSPAPRGSPRRRASRRSTPWRRSAARRGVPRSRTSPVRDR